MKPITAALALLLLAPCGCARRDASAQTGPAVTTAMAALPAPFPADLPPADAPPAKSAATAPEPAPSAEEVAAFHAPVPK